tara:strand:+ start:28095 stop:30065 length:1971 start_codon:yes stop_codon:yes gene_type:complete
MRSETDYIPLVLAGPILRRTSVNRVTLWLATRAPVDVRLEFDPGDGDPRCAELGSGSPGFRQLAAGCHLHYLLIDLALSVPLPMDCWIDYRIVLRMADEPDKGWQDAALWASDLCFPGRSAPGFILPSRVGSVLHGSCRMPHHDSGDGLVEAERLLARCLSEDDTSSTEATAWPSMLVLSGDQIYADDVAGPMLRAIHQLIQRLGLAEEDLSTLGLDAVPDARALYQHRDSYYRREQLLPQVQRNRALLEVFFGGVKKPVFTADNAHNHLITLGEYLAMYLLVWSPAPWRLVSTDIPEGLTPKERERYLAEQSIVSAFVEQLPAVRRLFAHLPVAMIFDDHDLSDDWNLNREWEETVYSHPFSQRIIGNGLLAYLINQGWGNEPEAFDEPLLTAVADTLQQTKDVDHEALIEQLLRFNRWGYQWSTEPPLIVLDTRTSRWRSESAAHKPSGLLDWEALTDLQHQLRGHSAVLLVSAAPIFGVKLIEVIQRIFTWIGKPLLVDAENWMAHPGTANGILNVFRHPKTPQHFVVLSGDVHYSFVYDVELRGRTGGPDIWQICSSGLRNTFPARLLDLLDRLNRWLYAPRSPLNWFTSRRRMRVIPRKPEGCPSGRRLLNAAGIGLVELDKQGRPWRIRHLVADGTTVLFVRREEESHWH